MSQSQKANIRRAWLSQRINGTDSDAKNIALCAAMFRVSQKTAKEDYAYVLDRWMEIDREMQPRAKARFMELGLDILAEAREAAKDPANSSTFAPVVAQFKTLAVMAGALKESTTGNSATVANESRPSDQTVRERLEALKANTAVRERAMRLGLDIKD